MRSGTRLAVALACLFLLGACGNLLDPAAAVVRGHKITVDEVQAVVDSFTVSEAYREAQERGEGAIAERQFERNYLAQLVRRAVLGPEAEKLGIKVTDNDIDAEIESIKADFPTEQQFQETLREQGLTPRLLRSLVADSLLEDELRVRITKDVGPTEQELIDYYDENIDDYKQKRASHILVEDKELAEDIYAQLDLAIDNKVDDLFVDLAAKHSADGSNASTGGDLGWFGEGAFVPQFEAAVEKLKEDEFSRPVKTEFGWHIILLTGERTKSFAQVESEIEQTLGEPMRDEAWVDWLEKTYDAAGVEVNPRYGIFDVETQSIRDPDSDDIPGGADVTAEPEQPVPVPPG